MPSRSASDRPTGDRAARALRRLLPGRQPRATAGDIPTRLANLEESVREVRTRINALFFAVVAVALGELLTRVIAG